MCFGKWDNFVGLKSDNCYVYIVVYVVWINEVCSGLCFICVWYWCWRDVCFVEENWIGGSKFFYIFVGFVYLVKLSIIFVVVL